MAIRPLKEFTKFVLLGELDFQTQIALNTAEQLLSHHNKMKHIEVWTTIQSFLVATGNVSKFLWPPGKKHNLRGEELRSLLGICHDNPLHDRTIRNHFEHYDERIEDWVENKRSSTYTDHILGPPSGFVKQFPENVHRGYDYTTQTITFRGETLDLLVIMEALKNLQQKLINQGYRSACFL